MLNAFQKMGGQIYEQTMVTELANNRTVCKTDKNYRVTSKQVVFATHFPTYETDKFLPKNLEPESSYAIAIKAKKEFPDGMYINIEDPKRTMRPIYMRGTQYILVGGESKVTLLRMEFQQSNDIMQYINLLMNFFTTTSNRCSWGTNRIAIIR